MATTVKSNLIIPEVLAPMVDTKLTNKIVLAPLADIDDTLVGQPGDAITIPCYAYIGAADVTDENGQIVPVALSATSVQKSVHKLTKAVQITDEARLSAYGDPVGEAVDQLAKSIADKTDIEMLEAVKGIGASRQYVVSSATLTADIVAEALEKFGEDQEGEKVALCSPAALTTLRKDDDYIKATEIGQTILIKGTIGEIWGCQLVPSNRLTNSNEEYTLIVKPGALGIINKRGVLIETEREPDYMRDTVYASKHYVPYLKDESKAVVIRRFTGLELLTTGIASTAGTAATNGTFVAIDYPAPTGYKWVYKLGTTDVTPVFGTALESYTDWVSATTEIAASTSTKACIALVNATDNKPVKYMNLTLVKKA